MTQIEYLKSGCNNRLSKFTFKNGKIVYGVITTYFQNEPNNYYLVYPNQMIEFKKYMDANDFEKMRQLCQPINLEELQKAELDSFGELLVKKSQEDEKNKVDWQKRKLTWLTSVEEFYKKINLWLGDLQSAGLLRINEREISLSEEYIGNYKTKKLEIYLGNDMITFTPKGTLIIGSHGRIDLRGPKGEILIVEPEWNDWKFARRTPKIKYWNVDEQSLKEAMQEIINA